MLLLRCQRPFAPLMASMVLVFCANCASEMSDGPDPEDPFADLLVSFSPGAQAGFGSDALPDIVLGPPRGSGEQAGSVHVVSLGRSGTIVVAFDDIGLIDGPGPDLLVFENPFSGFVETGEVAVSEDGVTWHSWPCAAMKPGGGASGCAGVHPVLSHDDPDQLSTNPQLAGGDAFDLKELGLGRARFVRVVDSGQNEYLGTSGGFDLDAVAVLNGEVLAEAP